MPEGDTIHRLATALAPLLVGRPLAAVRLRGRELAELVGRRVEAVRSLGKHLLVELDDGTLLRSHLGMYGSWHRYRPGDTWRRPSRQATLVVTLADLVLVCFNAREAEWLRGDRPRSRDRLSRLGPDLIREDPSPDRLLARALALLDRDTPVVDLLLDQRVAAGIGNVYKSEVLFVVRRSPLLRLGDLDLAAVGALYGEAARLLRLNLGSGPRVTHDAFDRLGDLWVYRRGGRPCQVCGTSVKRARLGRLPRSTYWCPSCQPDPGSAAYGRSGPG
jgi:endonuclease-8